MFRALKVTATGQWCGPLIEDDSFPDDGGAWAEAVATTLSSGPLTVVDSDSDPRTGELLLDPNIGPTPTPTPDPRGFEAAALSFLTTPTANALYAKYPLFVRLFDAKQWQQSRGILGIAEQAGDLSADQAATLTSLMTEYHIP